MNRLEIIKEIHPNDMVINYIFDGDTMEYINPEENELRTVNPDNPGYVRIHNLDSFLDYMSEKEFEKFIFYLKSL